MSKHPQRRPPLRWGIGMSRRNELRVAHEIAVFNKTGDVSEWLARKAAKHDWVRYKAFPALKPPEPSYDFLVNHYLTSQSSWYLEPK